MIWTSSKELRLRYPKLIKTAREAASPLIVFVKQDPMVRLARQAWGLRQTGRYRLLLLTQSHDLTLHDPYFDAVVTFRNIQHLRRLLRELDPLTYAFHAYGQPSWLSHVVIDTVKTPVIYDLYDPYTQRFGVQAKEFAEEVGEERYCYENASGVVHKAPLEWYTAKHCRITAPTAQILEYCVDDFIVRNPRPRLSDRTGELHLVYAGLTNPMHANPYNTGHTQFVPLAETICSQGIHFHIYPHMSGGLTYDDFPEYHRLAQRNTFFHFHKTTPFRQLPGELSQYDYNVKILLRPEKFSQHVPGFTTSAGNKLFAALEAGLPSILNEELEFECSLLRDNAIGVVVGRDDLGQLRQVLDRHDLRSLRENVNRARSDTLNMRKRISALEDLYRLAQGARA